MKSDPLRRPPIVAAAIAALALALYLPGLGLGDFVGDDEALDAGVVWQMVHDRDWLFAEFNGSYLPPKPPLFYWEAAAAASLHGRADEWSVRLPSALAGAALAGVTVAGGAVLVGPAPAAVAGLLLLEMPVVYGEARVGRADMTTALLVTIALFVFRLSADPMPKPARWLFYAALGLGALAKAGAAVGLVAVVVLVDSLWSRRRSRLRALVDPAVVLFVAGVGCWIGAETWRFGRRFLDHLMLENVGHFVRGFDGSRPPLSQAFVNFVYVFTDTLPWGLLVPAALAGAWRARREESADPGRFLIAWLLAGFVFFSIASHKSPYYLLPLTPPIALLVARPLWPAIASAGLTLRASTRDVAAATAAVGALGVALWAAASASSTCEIRAAGSASAAHPLLLGLAGIALVVLVVEGARALVRRERGRVAVLAWAVMALALLGADFLNGPLSNCESLRPFAREVAVRSASAERLFFFDSPLPAIALYAERRIPTLDAGAPQPETPFDLIVPQARDTMLPQAWRAGSEVLASGSGRVFTRRTMGIRLLRIHPAKAA